MFCSEELVAVGWRKNIAQVNYSFTDKKGTLRGMHYQIQPHSEMKLISCLQGEVFDVAIDLRINSPTYLHWHGEVLSENNKRSQLIPEGFAHGFQALTDKSTLLYCHSAPYNPKAERAINAQDPRLNIIWPLAISEISNRDANHPLIDAIFEGVQM